MEIITNEAEYNYIFPIKNVLAELRSNAPFSFYEHPAEDIIIYQKELDRLVVNFIINKSDEVQRRKQEIELAIKSNTKVLETGDIFLFNYVKLEFVFNVTTKTKIGLFSGYVGNKSSYVLAVGVSGNIYRLSNDGTHKVAQVLAFEELVKRLIFPAKKYATGLCSTLYFTRKGSIISGYLSNQISYRPQRETVPEYYISCINKRLVQVRGTIPEKLPDDSIDLIDGKYSLLQLTSVREFPKVTEETELLIDLVDDSVDIISGKLFPTGLVELTVKNFPDNNWILDTFENINVLLRTIGGINVLS